jgi:LCP family protein required for cell wall assembly
MGRRVSVTTPPRSGPRTGPAGPSEPITPAPGGGLPPNGHPADEPSIERPKRPGIKRMLLGCAIVLLASAGGSAVFVLEQVHNLRDALNQNGALKVAPGSLASASWGDPQTLLLVGDDQRSLTRYYHVAVPHLANEMLLVRLDPSKPYISMMSIPRELQVPIVRPNGFTYGLYRINSAYTYGIPTLLATVKHTLGLSVNHVVVITFGRFKRAVNEMGCVYSTVDRRYYHVNQPYGYGDQYQEINLQPGYQKLCGDHALQFVSYRHGDTSLVRDARDQSFLMDVKKQFGPTLADNVGKFERIFGKAVQTDPQLHSTTGLLNLLGTLIASSGRRVRQVHFQVNLLATYDTATPQQIASSVHAFLYGGSPIPSQTIAAAAHAVHTRKGAARLPLVATPSVYLDQARHEAKNLPFPIEFPRTEDRGGSINPPFLRGYLIHGPDGTAYPAYAAAFSAGQLGQFYDVQGMTWTTAPQFDSPDQTVRVGGRTYYLFYEGSHLKMVAWYEHSAVYWIRNSLTDSVATGEMLGIAEQTQPFTTAVPGRGPTRVILKAAGVPAPLAKTTKSDLRQRLGEIAAIVSLVAVPLLGFFAIRRIRDTRRVRSWLAEGGQIGARLPGFTDPLPPMAPAAASAGSLAPVGYHAGPSPGLPGHAWYPERTVYRGSRVRTPATILAVLAVLAAGGAAAWFVVIKGGSAHTSHPARARRAAKPNVPSVPVAVLNATPTPGAAHRLAVSLQSMGVKVSEVGNVTETRPPGTEILYSPGDQAQARRLARLLPSKAPTVSPIDPVTAAAAGAGAALVIVIT